MSAREAIERLDVRPFGDVVRVLGEGKSPVPVRRRVRLAQERGEALRRRKELLPVGTALEEVLVDDDLGVVEPGEAGRCRNAFVEVQRVSSLVRQPRSLGRLRAGEDDGAEDGLVEEDVAKASWSRLAPDRGIGGECGERPRPLAEEPLRGPYCVDAAVDVPADAPRVDERRDGFGERGVEAGLARDPRPPGVERRSLRKGDGVAEEDGADGERDATRENERGRIRKDERLGVEPDERPRRLLDEALDLRGGEDLPRVRKAPEPGVALQRVRGDAGPVPEGRRLLEDGVDDDVDGSVGERPAEAPERVDEEVRLARLGGIVDGRREDDVGRGLGEAGGGQEEAGREKRPESAVPVGHPILLPRPTGVRGNWLREKGATGPIVEGQYLTSGRVSAGLSREPADGPGFSEVLRSEAGYRLEARTVRGRRADRTRRDGRGLSRPRHAPREGRCPQGPPGGRARGRGTVPKVRTGSARRWRPEPPERRRPLRRRQPGRRALPRLGAARGGDSPREAPARTPFAAARRGDCGAGRPGARRRAREGDRPPRPEARERLPDGRRSRQDPRLRPREAPRPRVAGERKRARGGRADGLRRRRRHGRLHGSGAGAR